MRFDTFIMSEQHEFCNLKRHLNTPVYSFLFKVQICRKKLIRSLHVEQGLPTLPEHLDPPRVLVEFVLLNIIFLCSVQQIIVLLFFFFWLLYCLSFFELILLITPLIFNFCSSISLIVNSLFFNLLSELTRLKITCSLRRVLPIFLLRRLYNMDGRILFDLKGCEHVFIE